MHDNNLHYADYYRYFSMIYQEPELSDLDQAVLGLINKQREKLKIHTQNNPRRWFGSLRRSTFARAIQGSNSIEGYNATLDEAIAVIEDEPSLDERTETWYAINGYRAAMTYVIQAAEDPTFEFSKQFLKSLHFMMIGFDLNNRPGQWRIGPIYVVRKKDGEPVYEGPNADIVDELICELVDYLQRHDNAPLLVRAAMAHLNLTMIHPFRDGNGRMARALQTLVLAREGLLNPVFSSIEEWLGRNTEEYYSVLAGMSDGAWSPAHDTRPWIQFCLKAHYQQAFTLIRRNEVYGRLFDEIDNIVQRRKLNDRAALSLLDAALGLRITNGRYQKDAEVTQYVAGRDLKLLSDLELLEPIGEKRGRYYVAGTELIRAREKAAIRRKMPDPYELAEESLARSADSASPRLPGF